MGGSLGGAAAPVAAGAASSGSLSLRPQGGQRVGNQIVPSGYEMNSTGGVSPITDPSGGKGGSANTVRPEAPAPTKGQYAPMAQPTSGFNVNQAAAGALQQAMQGTQAGMGFQAGSVLPTGYNASTSSASLYKPASMAAQGYQATDPTATGFQAAGVGSQGYQAAGPSAQGYSASTLGAEPSVSAQNVQAGQLAGRDLGAYTNPFETSVVDAALGDIERSRQMASNQLGAQASAAGAFGGSRQGIAEAETNRAFAEQAAETASGLRQAGFTQAQVMAQADIGTAQQAALANQQAGLQAGTTTAQLQQQGALSNQAARNAAAQFGASAQNTAAQQTAAAQNAAAQFGAAAANQAAAQTSAQQQAASQFGAAAQNAAAQQAAAQRTTASQFGATAANQAAAANMAAQNQAGQFGATALNQMALSNQAAQNQASQFGAQQAMTAQQLNQMAGLQANQQRLGAASQMGQLGQQAFNTGQTIQQQQMQQGLMQQGLQQALIDAARGQYAGYTGSPGASLNAPLAALGVAGPNSGSTTTNTSSPGLFDYLGLGFGLGAR